MVKIAATVLTKSYEEFPKLVKKGQVADMLQVDIMDGKFVPTKSISLKKIKKINSRIPVEVDLMVENPENYLDDCFRLGFKRIIFHVESTEKIDEIIENVHKRKLKVAAALRPETPIKNILPYLNKLDFVQFKTVHPGYYGAKFLPNVIKKIKQLRKKSKIRISVDGGINDKTAPLLKKVKVNVISSGSFIMKSKNPKEAVKILKNA